MGSCYLPKRRPEALLHALEALSSEQKLDLVEFIWLYARANDEEQTAALRGLTPFLEEGDTDRERFVARVHEAISYLRGSAPGAGDDAA